MPVWLRRSAGSKAYRRLSRHKNEHALRGLPDDFGRSGIESASHNTADYGNTFDKVHRSSRARFRNESETDSLVDPFQKLAGDPEDHLSC
jgi:hypothetical protein